LQFSLKAAGLETCGYTIIIVLASEKVISLKEGPQKYA